MKNASIARVYTFRLHRSEMLRLALVAVFVAGVSATCPASCRTTQAGCSCLTNGTWAGGSTALLNGAYWDTTTTSTVFPLAWPPAYASLPPLYLGGSPGFTVTTWVVVKTPGELDVCCAVFRRNIIITHTPHSLC